MELIGKAMDKQAYLEGCLEELGGIKFSKSNIKVGYSVILDDKTEAEILSAGPQNVKYKILTGGAKGVVLIAAYAEIAEIINTEQNN